MEDFLLNKTILIVDDTPENIDVLNGLLTNFKRKIATNGERALKLALTDNPPDLILLDIMMPEMDGYEVCRKLRADKRTVDIPVIFLTAKTAKEDVVKGFEAGGQDYVTKPFDVHELMERVKTQLQLAHQKELLRNMNIILEQKVDERTSQLNESNTNLDKANKQLMGLDDAKNQFLMLISHEIRTPLNGIVGSAYFLKDMIEDPELVEFLDMLKESVDRLDNFSQTALEITQMQTVGRDLKKSTINIRSIIEKEIESINTSVNEKKITISTTYSEKEEIMGIEDYFKRAIKELIGNAIKFSNENTEIVISTFGEGDNLKISITDTGEVIPPEKIEDIIKPFGLGKDHYDKNIGLGLTYIKTFLDIHDATIEIKSSVEETNITLIFNLV